MSRCGPLVISVLVLAGAVCPAEAGHPGISTPPPTVLYRKPVQTFGFPGSTYRWGWFGANYYPRVVAHGNYYGRDMQFSYRRGY